MWYLPNYDHLVGKGIFVRFYNKDGNIKELVGILDPIEDGNLIIKSRGSIQQVPTKAIIKIREAGGEVEP